jgi:hypothetical protein
VIDLDALKDLFNRDPKATGTKLDLRDALSTAGHCRIKRIERTDRTIHRGKTRHWDLLILTTKFVFAIYPVTQVSIHVSHGASFPRHVYRVDRLLQQVQAGKG